MITELTLEGNEPAGNRSFGIFVIDVSCIELTSPMNFSLYFFFRIGFVNSGLGKELGSMNGES